MYTTRMSAQIIKFPARPAAMPMPAIEAWIEEVDGIEPEPPPLVAEMLLRRAPELGHQVAAWLATFVRRPNVETN